jgi:Starter unit:ACP transacylase in aflatoxin biosynthesis
MSKSAVSAAIFSPQSSPPKRSYLARVRSELLQEELLKPLLDAVLGLPETWHIFASSREDIANLENGLRYTRSFSDWIETGESNILETAMSGIVTLPLLTIIHIVQYFQYLKRIGSRHSQFLRTLHDGGVQGYCIGLLSAIIVASSKDERELVKNAAAGIRISLGIGAFGDIGETSSTPGLTTMVIRVRRKSEGEEIVEKFPGVRIPFSPSFEQDIIIDSSSPIFRPSPTQEPSVSSHLLTKSLKCDPTQRRKGCTLRWCIFEVNCTTQRTLP